MSLNSASPPLGVIEFPETFAECIASHQASPLPFEQLLALIEAVSCSSWESLRDLITRIDLTSYSYPELAILNSYLAVESWIHWDLAALDRLFAASLGKAAQEKETSAGRHAQAHMKLCARLMVLRLRSPEQYQPDDAPATLHVIGDSHSLCFSALPIVWKGRLTIARAMPVRGVKMFHLGAGVPAKYRQFLRWRLKSLQPGSEILLSMGEIDARPNEGIFPQAFKAGMANLKGFEQITQATVREFVRFVTSQIADTGHVSENVTLMGIPPIGYDIRQGLPPGASVQQFRSFNARVNAVMREHALAAGWTYIDLQAGAMRMNPTQSKNARIDDFHLGPTFYKSLDAWRVAPPTSGA